MFISNPVTMTPKDAIQKFKEGDPDAFRFIYTQYKKQVMNYCMTMVVSRENAEELVNDIFLHLYLKRNFIDVDRDLKPYLFTITRNRTYNWLKQAAKSKNSRRNLEQEYRLDYLHHQDEKIDAGLDLQILESTVDKMPLQRRLIFKMCKFQEMSYAEVAEALSLKRKTVENQMGLANKQFAELANSADYVFLIVVIGSML